MAAILRDAGLPGILPVAPRFDFHEPAVVEAVAEREALAAMMEYEAEIRHLHYDRSVELGAAFWAAKRPWWLGVV